MIVLALMICVTVLGVITTTPSPVPPSFTLRSDGLTIHIPQALLALPPYEPTVMVPAEGDLIPLPISDLFGRGYLENEIRNAGWRWWGLKGQNRGGWGRYEEQAWVIGYLHPFDTPLLELAEAIDSSSMLVPQVPMLRNQACSVEPDVVLMYQGFNVQPLSLANAEGFSAFYLCLTRSYGYGDGPECGGAFSDYIPSLWYAAHIILNDGGLLLIHVPVAMDLPFRSASINTCYDANTERSTTTYDPPDWEAQGWQGMDEDSYAPRLTPEGEAALYAEIEAVVIPQTDDRGRQLARIRAALDETFATLTFEP